MNAPVVQRISAAEARPLRQAVLRPGRPPETTVYPGDEAAETVHFGARLEGRLAGIATLLHNAPPGESDPGAWQLRGMAVLPEHQGRGYGRALVLASREHAAAQGGTRLWCNGRVSALPFYRALGFEPRGEMFESPHSGPHFQLHLRLGR